MKQNKKRKPGGNRTHKRETSTDIIDKAMSFVNRTFEEAKYTDYGHILRFAFSGFVKLALLYGFLWILTRFVDIHIK